MTNRIRKNDSLNFHGYDKRVGISERSSGRSSGHVPNSQGGPSGRPRGRSRQWWSGLPKLVNGKYVSQVFSTKGKDESYVYPV